MELTTRKLYTAVAWANWNLLNLGWRMFVDHRKKRTVWGAEAQRVVDACR